MNEYLTEYLPFVKVLVVQIHSKNRFSNVFVESGDLMNAGVIGLIGAIKKYDPARATKFWVYAHKRVRGAIQEALINADPFSRPIRKKIKNGVTTSKELHRSMKSYLERERWRFASILPFVVDVRKLMEVLSFREREIMELLYIYDLKPKEIGPIFKITGSRISQIRIIALAKMRGHDFFRGLNMNNFKVFEERSGVTPYDLHGDDSMEDLIDAINDFLYDFARGCSSRPALWHEKEEHGHARFLTRKGWAKFEKEKKRICDIFNDVFEYLPDVHGHIVGG